MRKRREENFVTIRDVAKKANVSIATVSRVINDGRVKEERKKRVLNAIKELDYVPNNSARNIAAVNATKRIQMLVPNIDDYCYREMIKGFKMGAKLYNYDPTISDYMDDYNIYEETCRRVISSSETRGIVLVGPQRDMNNKYFINMNEKLLSIAPDKKYLNKNIGIFFENDNYLYDYFVEKIFDGQSIFNISETKNTKCDYYIVKSIKQAADLINNGITAKIYVLEEIGHLDRIITNIEFLPFDFYAIGLALSRITIKKLTGILSEDDPGLVLKIN